MHEIIIMEPSSKVQEIVTKLRKDIYVDELHILDEEGLWEEKDNHGYHVVLKEKARDRFVGCLHICWLNESGEEEVVDRFNRPAVYCSRLMIEKEHWGRSVMEKMCFAGIAQYKMLGAKNIVAFLRDGDLRSKSIANLQLIEDKLYHKNIGDDKIAFQLFGQEIEAGLNHIWAKMDIEAKEEIRLSKFGELLDNKLHQSVKKFVRNNDFIHQVEQGSLTKNEYMNFLSTLYQFVQHTTRILSKAASISQDVNLHNHFLTHASGEVGHEKILESDMIALGGDVDYCKSLYTNTGTLIFNALQESFVSHRRDPVNYLAVPFSVEGLSALWPLEVVDRIEYLAKENWGIENPKKITSFLRSHIEFDGGEDGHLEHNKQILGQCLKDSRSFMEFAKVSDATFMALNLALNECINEIWS